MTDILNQFRDEDLPPSRVDIAEAVRTGRRHRRTRTLLAVGGTVVALVAGGVTVPLLISPQPVPVPPVETTCGSPEPTQASLPSWERFDPLTLEIDASGVTGYRVRVSSTSTYWQVVNLDRDGTALEEEPGAVTVVLYACGGQPHSFDEDRALPFNPRAGEPGDPVGGARSYWVPPDMMPPGETPAQGLAWQWTPGAWAIVLVGLEPDSSAVDPASLRTVATQVAQQVRLGAGTPVTSPFSMPLPDGTYLAVTVTHRASDFGRSFPVGFGIGFNAVGTPNAVHPFPSAFVPSLTVDASTFASHDDRPATATEYPEDLGYPAYQDVVQDGSHRVDSLLVYDFFGFGMQISPGDIPGASTRPEKLSLAADVFRTITAYPDAADSEESWGDPISPPDR